MSACVIFDVDGTLFDTGEGIKECVRLAIKESGAVPLTETQLDSFIGPSLFYSFSTTAGLNEEQTKKAVENYRAHYWADGVKKAAPYAGIREVLNALRADGYTLAIASSKPIAMVEFLLEAHDMKKYFARVIAVDYARTDSDKAVLIKEALAEDSGVMVGDTRFDIDGAHTVGIRAIAAAYGYGSADTLADAEYTANSPQEVYKIVRAHAKEIFAA